jgi:hypothetical protein
LLVSAATTSWTFGHAFNEEYEDAHKMEVERQVNIFGFLRVGYEALFKLNTEDAAYVSQRKAEINAVTELSKNAGKVIGMHIRHGDRHPFEFQYRESYIPIQTYVNTANVLANDTSAAHHDYAPVIVLASDDPLVYRDSDVSSAFRAQEHILLASKDTMGENGEEAQSADVSGWEGGFFKEMFWSLGKPRKNAAAPTPGSMMYRSSSSSIGASKEEDDPTESAAEIDLHREKTASSPETLKMREFVGRAYLLDLAVLGEVSSGGIVCTVSSTGCRLLAVMMGWERAVEQKTWRNVDGLWDWKGIIW